MMNWAVPVFFMITGALLLNPEKMITASDCVFKYCRRIVLALLIFGIPFAVLRLVMETGIVAFSLLPLSVKAVLENQSLAHLWYLYVLIGIYLVLPVLRWFVAKAENKEVWLVITALIVTDFVIPLINNVFRLNIAFDIPLKYAVLYVLLGWYLNKADMKRYRKYCLILMGSLTAVIWGLNYTVKNAAVWTSYNSPLILLLAITVFVIFKETDVRQTQWLWNVDRLCFAVYLIHPVFIQFTYRFLKITPTNELYPVVTLLFFVVFLIAAFVGSWVLNKIKPLKKYVL